MNHNTVLIGCAAAALAAASGAQARTYLFSTISAPGAPAGDINQALGINDAGQVLVSALNPNGPGPDNVDVNDVYNLHTKAYTPLSPYPGAVAGSSLANGINDSGVTVGQYDPGGVNPFGFTLGYSHKGGVFQVIDRNGLPLAFAIAVSNNGQVTGGDGALTTGEAFLESGGHYTEIDAVPPDGNWTTGEGVNNSGTVVGTYGSLSTGLEGSFIDVGGVISQFTAPGWATTQITGINDKGQIVGLVADDSFDTVEGFIDDRGAFTFLSFPGATHSFIAGINNLGDIVGRYRDANGNVQAYLATPSAGGGQAATPAPEPAAWLTMILGVAMVGLGTRRRHAVGVVAN
jgi:hypothetical protein